jgi:hypothetical protein
MLEGASLSTRPYDMTVGDNTKEEARENSWDDRVLVLLSTAAAPLPPPLRREAPAPVNAEPSRTGDEAEVTNVPRNTANTSAATSTMDVADEMMFLPPRLHFEPGVPFDRASTTPNSTTPGSSFRVFAGAEGHRDPLLEAETAERELLSSGIDDDEISSSNSGAVQEALDALKPFTSQPASCEQSGYAGVVVRLLNAHKELSLAIVGNVQGKPASIAVGPGGSTAVGTTNGIIILSRPENMPCSPSLEHWDIEGHGDDAVKETKTKTTTLGIPVPGATVSSLAFGANGRGAGLHPADSWLLAGHRDGRMVLWDVMRGTAVKEMRGAHQSPLIAVALVSPMMAAAAAAAALATVNGGSNGNIDGSLGNAGRLGSVGLSGASSVEALSASLSGTVSRHTLTSIGPLVRSRVSCLGERTAVLQFHPLPLLVVPPGYRSSDGIPPDVSADASGVVALLTSVAIIVMRLHPEAGVLAKLLRPSAPASALLPCFAWAPRIIGKNVSNDSQCTHMVVSWGHKIQLLELDLAAAMHIAPAVAAKDGVPHRSRHAAVRVRRELNVEAPVIALAWLTSGIIVAVLTTNRLVVVSSQTAEVIEALNSCEAPVHFAMEAATTCDGSRSETNNEVWAGEFDEDGRSRACHAAVAAQGTVLTILSRSHQCSIRQVRVMGWRECMCVRRERGDWGGAFAAALTASWERAPSLRQSLGAPPPPSVAAAAALDLLPQFLASVLRSSPPPALTACSKASTNSTAEAARTHALHVARAVIAVCLAADGLDRLYNSDVYDALIALPHIKAAFLELLVPHVLADRLSSLPPDVMQSLVEHFVHLGRPAAIERCVLHMDVASLDLNQCARLCKKHGLFSALAHIYNRALDDFIVPALALLNAAAAEAAAETATLDARSTLMADTTDCNADSGTSISATKGPDDGYYRRGPARKLLLYLRGSLRGQSFPPGRGTLPAERVPRVRAELLGFLLAPTAVVEPSPFPGSPPPSTSDGVYTPGLESKTLGFRRRWRGCDVGGAAGLAGVLWDAAGLPVSDDSTDDVSVRHRLPQRLAFLLGVETSVTLDILSAALEEWDATESECFEAAGVVLDGPAGGAGEDRMVSQVVVDCAIAAAEALNKATSASVDNAMGSCRGSDPGCEGEVVEAAAMACTRLVQFVAEFVGSGRATLTGVSRIQETLLLEGLALGPPSPYYSTERSKRESAMVAILARRIPSLTNHVGTNTDVGSGSKVISRSPAFALDMAPIEVACQLARRAGFHQAEAMCHMKNGNHLAALRTLAADPEQPVGALRYADALLGTNFCDRYGAVTVDNPADAAAHARMLKSDQADAFRASLLNALPLLATAAPYPTMHLAVTVFSASQDAVLATLNEPSQFRYLCGVFSCAATVVDEENVKFCTHLGTPHADCAANDDAANARTVPAKSDILCLSELIARSGFVITDVMTERYIHLMCQFEPHNVKTFLQQSPCGYHLKRCLTRCRYHGVSDAEAYVMERMGSADVALALPMDAYSSHLKDTVRRLIVGNSEDRQEDIFSAVGATNSVATLYPGIHSQSSHPFQVEVRDILVAALGLCSRNSSKRAWQRGNNIRSAATSETWLAFLDAVIKPLRQLRGKRWRRPPQAAPQTGISGKACAAADEATGDAGGPSINTPGSSTVSLRLTLEAHTCAVVDAMIKFGADSPVTLSKLFADNRCDEFGDFRFVLLGLLVRFAKEVEVLENARRCVTTDVHTSVSLKMLTSARGTPGGGAQLDARATDSPFVGRP